MGIKKSWVQCALTLGAIGLSASVLAQTMAEGVVRRIDLDNNKITIRHGEIKALDMPPMTMVFQVKDAAMLDQLKAGDKINFAADKVNGAYTVMQLEAAK